MDETKLLERITVNPAILTGKPIIRGRRLAVEHVLAMLAAGDSQQMILEGYEWLQGTYMGYLRSLTPRQKTRVKALCSAKGYPAAVKLAKKRASSA